MMEADDRKKSHKLYNIACAKFLKHMKGDFPLVQLSPTHIQSFADVMKAEGLKETSIRIYLTFNKSNIELCQENELCNLFSSSFCFI